jgi:hypothetical protein
MGLRREARKSLLAEARRHREWHLLRTCPGLGPVRTAELLPVVVTPYRFQSRGKFWACCGLGVVMRTSSDWVRSGSGQWMRASVQQTRGLNRSFNHTLKRVFKGAATTVIGRAEDEPLYRHYQRLLARNQAEPGEADDRAADRVHYAGAVAQRRAVRPRETGGSGSDGELRRVGIGEGGVESVACDHGPDEADAHRKEGRAYRQRCPLPLGPPPRPHLRGLPPGGPGAAGSGARGFRETREARGREVGAAVGGGAGGLVEDPANAHGFGPPRCGAGLERFGVGGSGWPAAGSRFALDAQAVEGEGRASAVADEPLAAGAVGALDAHCGVDAESAGALPGEHVVCGVHIEEVAALEEAEDAALEDGRECGYVIGGEVGGLVEAHLAVDFGENTVEDHEMEVEVGVEGGAEPVEEGDGTDLRVEASAGTAVSQGGPNGAEEDPEHGPGEGGVVVEEGADPFGDGEHPLADRQRRQDVIVQVGGDLHHSPGVARGAHAAALAGEGYEALGGAVVAPDPGEAMGQDAAAQVGPEVLLDPARHALAPWVGLGGPGQESLEVVLDDGVQGRGGGPAAAVDCGGAGGRGGMSVGVEPTARRGPG